jgi:hypothetical protein
MHSIRGITTEVLQVSVQMHWPVGWDFQVYSSSNNNITTGNLNLNYGRERGFQYACKYRMESNSTCHNCNDLLTLNVGPEAGREHIPDVQNAGANYVLSIQTQITANLPAYSLPHLETFQCVWPEALQIRFPSFISLLLRYPYGGRQPLFMYLTPELYNAG